MEKCFIILFQYFWNVHFKTFTDFLHKNVLILSNNKSVHYKAFSMEITKATFWLRSKKQVFRDEKIQKAAKIKLKKNIFQKKPDWFCSKTIDPICFHKDGGIVQRKMMLKKIVSHELSWLYANVPWYFVYWKEYYVIAFWANLQLWKYPNIAHW